MAQFTPKSTSKVNIWRNALLDDYPILHYIANTVCFENLKLNPNNHGFRNTFDYNHCMCRDYLLYTVTASGHLRVIQYF